MALTIKDGMRMMWEVSNEAGAQIVEAKESFCDVAASLMDIQSKLGLPVAQWARSTDWVASGESLISPPE
jgi:hypothetical protein